MFRWILMLGKRIASPLSPHLFSNRHLFTSRGERRKARRIPSVKLCLEQLEVRLTPSATGVDSQQAAQPIVAALMQQETQVIVTFRNEAIGFAKAITQELAQAQAYFVLQLDQILGIAPNPQNLSISSSMPPDGNASGNGSVPATITHIASNQQPSNGSDNGNGTTTITHVASNQQPSNGTQPAGNGSGSSSGTTIKPTGSPVRPDAVAEGGYLWDPTIGTNASNGQNWDYNGQSQVGNPKAMRPGDTPDNVVFDPALTNPNTHPGLHGNGASPITWDYAAKINGAMQLGGQSAYTGKQTINSGITVEVTAGVGANATVNSVNSNLYLFFTDGTSKFQTDANSTITNMKLTGAYQGQFIINGGTTYIAQAPAAGQPVYTETIGVNVTVNPGATLTDWGQNTVTYTNDNVQLLINGTMTIVFGPNATNLLIDNGGNVDDFINVNGGTLNYFGSGGVTDTIKMPVAAAGGGTFYLGISKAAKEDNGKLIVQGANATTQNESVLMVGPGSSVQLSFGDTLECDSGYGQSNGTLETVDATTCTLQSGPTGTPGTVDIVGGSLIVDEPSKTGYATFNVNCSTLNFAGQYVLAIDAKAQGQGSCDLLNVNGTTNLQGASLYVWVNNAPPNGGSKWVIIQDNPATNLIKNGAALPITTNPQTNLNGSVNNNQYLLSF